MAAFTRPRAVSTTSGEILDVAERLTQTRGFNGYSYADIAAELGITKAAVHYHFAGKADLGRALIERYSLSFGEALARIEASEPDAGARLQRYVELYRDVLSRDRICLCGMLAAEVTTLPDQMRKAIRRFFDDNEAWLARVLDAGRRDTRLTYDGNARDAARVLTSALEGAMLLARSYGDASRFATAAEHLLREFTRPSGKRAVRSEKSPQRRTSSRRRTT